MHPASQLPSPYNPSVTIEQAVRAGLDMSDEAVNQRREYAEAMDEQQLQKSIEFTHNSMTRLLKSVDNHVLRMQEVGAPLHSQIQRLFSLLAEYELFLESLQMAKLRLKIQTHALVASQRHAEQEAHSSPHKHDDKASSQALDGQGLE